MTKIAGYASRSEAKWPYVLVITLILLAAVAVLLAFIPEGGEKTPVKEAKKSKPISQPATPEAKPVIENAGIKVEKIVFTSELDDSNQPTDELENISLKENGTVYCYARISSSGDSRSIRHVWINPAGAVVADVKLNVSSRPHDTYSYISLYGAKAGKWELQVRTVDDQIVAQRGFTTY